MGAVSRFRSIRRFLLDLLFPLACVGCGQAAGFLCHVCKGSLRSSPPQCFGCGRWVLAQNRVPAGRTCSSCRRRSHIYAFLSPLSFEDARVRDLIHALKYQRVRAIAPLLGGFLAAYVREQGMFVPLDVFLLPVPLHPSRKRVRGFNQSELIAHELKGALGVPLLSGVAERVKRTKPQVNLRMRERDTNMAGAFRVTDPAAIRAKTLVLVDDVKTSGATLEALASTLRHAGARRIWAITVAH